MNALLLRPMRFALLTSTAALAVATLVAPAAAQTIVIPPSLTGAEVGPFGNDASYGFTTALVGQSFVASGVQLVSFTFSLRNEVGTTVAPRFRAYVADWDPLNGTIGTVRFSSSLLSGQSSASYAPLTVTANTSLTSGLQYIAYLAGVTSTSGVNYLATNDAAPYGNGALVYDLGGSLNVDTSQDAAFTAVFAPAATTVPEPATFVLLAGGLAGVAIVARRRRTA